MKDKNTYESPVVRSSHSCDGLKVTLAAKGHTIEEVLIAFEAVLRGCTYSFNGRLEINDDE